MIFLLRVDLSCCSAGASTGDRPANTRQDIFLQLLGDLASDRSDHRVERLKHDLHPEAYEEGQCRQRERNTIYTRRRAATPENP